VRVLANENEEIEMFTTTEMAQAEMQYRQERIRSEFARAAARRERREERAHQSRHARRALRLRHAA
jgi:hypothetical protein